MRLGSHTLTERLFPARSSRWLGYALISTVLIVVGGSLLMYELFRSRSIPSLIADDEPRQVITVVIDRAPGGPSQWNPYIAVLRQIQEQTRVPVRARYIAGRMAMDDALQDSEVDMAFVYLGQYVELPPDAEYELLATPVVAGNELESAVIVVAADSPHTSFADLRGASIALAPGSSIRGYAYPAWLASRANSTLEEYFGDVRAGGDHAENLELVLDGQVDAAAVGRTNLLAWPPGTFRVVAESPEIGMTPLIMSTRLPAYFRDNLRAGLAAMGPGDGLPVDGLVDGFYFPAPEDYWFARVLHEYTDPTVEGRVWGEPR